jgi:hypothetical protein
MLNKLLAYIALTLTNGSFVLSESTKKYPDETHQAYHLHTGKRKFKNISNATNYKINKGKLLFCLASYDFSTMLGLYFFAI